MTLFLSLSLPAQDVQSPDGTISVTFRLESGRPLYEVSYKGKSVLEASPLGLESSIGSFAAGLQVAESKTETIDERYTLPHGKTREVHYQANELTVRLSNAQNDTLEILFRVSSRDVALAYRVSSGDNRRITIEREKLYEDIMTDGNLYGLMMNFHGATLPRGWERMYPNHMTSEAVTASENLIFSQGFANREAFNSTVFPFVRNPVAAMDYGPVLLNKRFHRNENRGNRRRTTDTFQLATAVLFQSPLQHFGLTPDNLEEQPDYVIAFLEAVPAAWDEVRYVDGYPGKHVVLARRSGQSWYIAATHADRDPMEMTVSLPWLKGKSLNHYYDQEDRMAGLKTTVVGEDGNVPLSLAVGGGAVLVYTP